MYGQGWMDLVVAHNMVPGVKLVFTNWFNNRARMIIFKEDGKALTEKAVRRTLEVRGDPYPGVDEGDCL